MNKCMTDADIFLAGGDPTISSSLFSIHFHRPTALHLGGSSSSSRVQQQLDPPPPYPGSLTSIPDATVSITATAAATADQRHEPKIGMASPPPSYEDCIVGGLNAAAADDEQEIDGSPQLEPVVSSPTPEVTNGDLSLQQQQQQQQLSTAPSQDVTNATEGAEGHDHQNADEDDLVILEEVENAENKENEDPNRMGRNHLRR